MSLPLEEYLDRRRPPDQVIGTVTSVLSGNYARVMLDSGTLITALIRAGAREGQEVICFRPRGSNEWLAIDVNRRREDEQLILSGISGTEGGTPVYPPLSFAAFEVFGGGLWQWHAWLDFDGLFEVQMAIEEGMEDAATVGLTKGCNFYFSGNPGIYYGRVRAISRAGARSSWTDWLEIELSGRRFIALDDTPESYTGKGRKVAAVASDESGIVFVPGGGGGTGGEDQKIPVVPSPRWHVDGPLAEATEVDGVWFCPYELSIPAILIYCQYAGTASSTIVDIDYSIDYGATWNTIFPVQERRPELAFDAGVHLVRSETPHVWRVNAGALLRANIAQVATDAGGITICIDAGAEVDLNPSLFMIMGMA